MKIRNRTSQQEIRFFCILGMIAFTLAGANSNSHTMRAVSPQSMQITAPTNNAPAKPKVDEDKDNNAEDLDFDDDFSVLV